MKILIIGAAGQIGHELTRELAAAGTIIAPPRAELDIADAGTMRHTLRQIRPAIVVNAAAYTAVDRAESEPDRCARINSLAPALLAAECRALGAALVHFSSDYVFDGAARTPYVETDATAPVNVYGQTKLAGELAIAAAGCAHLIFRTSWVYAARGRNFPLTMLRLARERDALDVVDDQVGAPTSAGAIARGVSAVLGALMREQDWMAALEAASGVYHMTAAGSTTWYEFARVVLADDPRPTEQTCRAVRPVRTPDYPTPARRPLYSVLDNAKLAGRFGVRLAPWGDQWRDVAAELRVSARPAFVGEREARRADPT